jgi:hypothetical protein
VLDPEPPPRPWWWRVLVSAGLLAAAAAVAAAVAFWPFSPGPARPGPAAGPSRLPAAADRGRIVTTDPAGYLALADPDGTHLTTLHALGNVGQEASASPDDRYFSLGNGQVAVVRTGATLASYAAKVPVTGNNTPASPDAFADDDRDMVILLGYDESTQNPVTVVSLATGSSRSLGFAAEVAGDPQAPGVFVSVAAPPRASATVTEAFPDSRVELRDAGRPPVVLATAGTLDRDLGYPADLSVALIPYPSPSGTEVAVVVLPAAGRPAAGIVILNRSGRLLGTAAGSAGLPPAWSPSGAALAYDAVGSALTVWRPGGRTVTQPIPPTGSGYSCIWSPDGMSILCASLAPTGGGQWEIASAAGRGKPVAVRGPGLPLAWLPSGGGR